MKHLLALLILSLCLPALAHAGLVDVYVAQSSGGSQAGTDCQDPLPITFFTTTTNWGTGAGQIGAGTTVHLCGVITTALTVRGSGVAGNPITILFEQDARISVPYCTGGAGGGAGCIELSGRQYIVVDGGANGVIENTANGTSPANHVNAHGVDAAPGSNIIVRNLTFQNLYVYTCCSDPNEYGTGVFFYGGANDHIYNNTCSSEFACVIFQAGNGVPGGGVEIDHNTVGVSVAWGIVYAEGDTTTSSSSDSIHDNDIVPGSGTSPGTGNSWCTGSTDRHHLDPIHTWAQSANGLLNNYIYNNYIHGNFCVVGGVANSTAAIFNEAFGNGAGKNHPIVFNNLILESGGHPADGALYANNTVSADMYNNTVDCAGADAHSLGAELAGGTSATWNFYNNVIENCNQAIRTDSGGSGYHGDFNDWYNIGNGGWVWNSGSQGTFAQWITNSGQDKHSITSNPEFNPDYTLTAGSPALQLGENLSSKNIAQLNLDKPLNVGAGYLSAIGNERPATALWDAGAYEYGLQAGPPTFTPPPGSYDTSQSISLSDSTTGASLFYTTDGSPATSSSTPYAGPVSVAQTTTINAIATLTGEADSVVSAGTYTIQAALPVFNPGAGTYLTPPMVSLSDSTPGSLIFYTIDGSVPTISSIPYAGPISVGQTTTIKAFATTGGELPDSGIAGATYSLQTPAPVFSSPTGTYAILPPVTLSDAAPGATIYYTIDGSAPTLSSAVYMLPISIAQTTTIKALALLNGWANSSTASVSYTIQVAVPTFSAPGGTYGAAQQIALSDATPNAAIHYTTNGSTPTASSTLYTVPISVTQTTTVKAIALLTGSAGSGVASATYTLQPSPPTFSPGAGAYATAQSVALSDAVPGVTIYYTTNGSKPTTSSTRYSNPISVTQPTTINAIAALTGWTTSAVATSAYTMQAAMPTFSVAAGTYSTAQSVVLSDATSGATIYYTTNSSIPTTSSTRYNGAIAVKQSTTIRAVASVRGWTTSGVGSAVYVLQAAMPSFSVPGGSYTTAQSVVLSDATSGVTIYYTTNGSIPTTSSTRYSGAISVKATTTINAIAAASGWTSSGVASSTYTFP